MPINRRTAPLLVWLEWRCRATTWQWAKAKLATDRLVTMLTRIFFLCLLLHNVSTTTSANKKWWIWILWPLGCKCETPEFQCERVFTDLCLNLKKPCWQNIGLGDFYPKVSWLVFKTFCVICWCQIKHRWAEVVQTAQTEKTESWVFCGFRPLKTLH